MSVFTNPANAARESAQAYITAVLGLVEGRDPMEVLGATGARLRELIAGRSEGDLHRPERDGKWSLAQVVAHLADSELVWGYRMRRILAEPRPRIEGYDQDLWAERLDYASADVASSLAVFDALRTAHLRLLAATTAADLRRVGVHDERGEESVAHLIRLYAGHDLLHLRQMERIAAAPV
jgi:uncharacterized damage-inducible protein DinB